MRISALLVATWVVSLVVAGSPSEAAGQDPSIALGTRIRLTTSRLARVPDLIRLVEPDAAASPIELDRATGVVTRSDGSQLAVPRPGSVIAGRLLKVTAGTVTLMPDRSDRPVVAPRAFISKIEQTVGRRSRGKGALIGLLVGVPVGVVLGLASQGDCDSDVMFACSPAAAAVGGAIVGGGAGATVGAIRPAPERWAEIDLASFTTSAESATVEEPMPSAPGRWTAGLRIGHPSAGPAGDLETAMRGAGFDSDAPAFFTRDPTPHPFSRTGLGSIGVPMSIEVGYGLKPSWDVSAFWQRTPIGETLGYSHHGEFLFVQYAVDSAGVKAAHSIGPLRIAAGPARYTLRTKQQESGAPEDWLAYSGWGFVAEAGVKVPRETRAYLDVTVCYRHMRKVTVGPFVPRGYQTAISEVPLTKVDASHWLIAFGPGFRF
jgi:hypothetical protein